jgi:hypothetical protein
VQFNKPEEPTKLTIPRPDCLEEPKFTHVGELIIEQVIEELKIEASKSPDVTLLTRFQKDYDQVPHSSDAVLSSKFDHQVLQ